MNFTLNDIKKQFSQKAYSLGVIYAQKKQVQSVKRTGNLIRSEVNDLETHNCYKQNIFIKSTTEGLQFQGTCSCQLVLNCHHVVSALLFLLQRNEQKNLNKSLQAMAPLNRWMKKIYSKAYPDSPDAEHDDVGTASLRRLIFVLTPDASDKRVFLGAYQAKYTKQGTFQSVSPVSNIEHLLEQGNEILSDEEQYYARLFSALIAGHRQSTSMTVEPRGVIGYRLLSTLMTNGRLFWINFSNDIGKGLIFPLSYKTKRPVRLSWQETNGIIRLNWEFSTKTPRRNGSLAIDYVLPTEPAMYIENLNCGEMVLDGSEDSYSVHEIHELLSKAPIMRTADKHLISMLILEKGLENVIPKPIKLKEVLVQEIEPKPVLYLGCQPYFYQDSQTPIWFDYAQLKFEYADQTILYGSNLPIIRRRTDDCIERVSRNTKTENVFYDRLQSMHFHPEQDLLSPIKNIACALVLNSTNEWIQFTQKQLSQLENEGWKIEKSPDYQYNLQPIKRWYASISKNENPSKHDWFDLDLGIVVNKTHYSLFPILQPLLVRYPDSFKYKTMDSYGAEESLLITLPNKNRVALPWRFVRSLLKILAELYYLETPIDVLQLHRLDAARLAELDQELPLQWINGSSLLKMGHKLLSFNGVQIVKPPQSLQANLRDYQLEGVSWMQFLREYGLAGILADDMGLGKTLQTLAHILLEKESGRLNSPALIVVPTSLVSNWNNEAQRFVPKLKVLQLHGKERTKYFSQIQQYDIVLTTYALLPRDEKELQQYHYHLLILDESQYIKNVRSKAAQIVSTLQAHHKLCLTGTPLENHLGELWSQFHFLLPGLLGNERTFNRNFRYAIERSADATKQSLLARRIRPFLLRRTKDKVARELPMKTEIVRYVELTTAQQQIYESVRELLEKKVREEIESYGISHCQIIILEALLKLRQVCCDPRLLRGPEYKQVNNASAKLTALLAMIEELLLENRHILVFSQFTSMLALIEQALIEKDISYVVLTGETVNRAQVIDQFQSGQVPVFLVSLKAGGVGLNLTAADTVIHYDPWWNPAVENQATDRAWRIGQDKPVFVYRLITKGTLEEKIQQLQQRKAKLSDAMLDDSKIENVQITMEELKLIFQPIQSVVQSNDAE